MNINCDGYYLTSSLAGNGIDIDDTTAVLS